MLTLNKFWKIIKSQKWGLLLQFGIFLGLAVALTFIMPTADDDFEFEPVANVDIAIFDRDQTPVSESFVTYFTELHEMIDLEDSDEVFKDMIMFNQIGLIVVIPEGFTQSIVSGDGEIGIEYLLAQGAGLRPFFVLEQIENYFRILNLYLVGGFDLAEASSLTAEAMGIGVEVQVVDVDGESFVGSYLFYRFLPLSLLILIGLSMGGIFMSFNKVDLIRRIESAPVSVACRTVERVASSLVFSFIGWGVFIGASFILFPEMTLQVSWLRIANTVPLVFLGIALAFMMIQFVNTRDMLFSGIFTIVFIATAPGVLMDLGMLADAFLNVIRFTPVYWYTRVNDMLMFEQNIDWGLFAQGIVIQLAFAVALFAVALVFSKEKRAKSG